MKKVLFLHGFYASGSCTMAIALKKGLDGIAEVITPDLPLHPKEALNLVENICAKEEVDLLIGNSNGAFLAQIIATALNIPAVLGNPHLEMSGFVKQRIGQNRYKFPRMDGILDFTIEESLADEFEELETKQFDNWSADKKNLCACIFGKYDNLAQFENVLSKYYVEMHHFPGDHTPTAEEVQMFYVPVIKQHIDLVCTEETSQFYDPS